MPKRPPPSFAQDAVHLTTFRPPQHSHETESSTAGSSSDLVHVSSERSRQSSPFTALAHPDHFRAPQVDAEEEDFDACDDDGDLNHETGHYAEQEADRSPANRSQMSDSHSQPLLAGDKQAGYESPRSPELSRSRSSTFKGGDADRKARAAMRKRYTYAAVALAISLVSFAVQTETAVYVQHNLNWPKPYCMLYFTHGSWSLLYPTMLLVMRLQKWRQPWRTFWRRHVQSMRETGQMVQHKTLDVPPRLQKRSPVPYFLRTTAFVTTALTIAGGSWYVAVNLTTASDLTAIYNCSAFFAYAFAIPMLHEKLRWSKLLAVGIAIAGVLVVAYGDTSTAKHGSKSGGGTGGSGATPDSEALNRTLGNLVIGVGSVLYGFYEVLYKRVACPPEGCPPHRGMTLAMTFGSLMGSFTLLVLWIPLPILHVMGVETFELPRGEQAAMLLVSVLANAVFSGSFLVLISLTSPVLSSVAALLTIFIVALCDEFLPEPLYHPLTGAAIAGGLLIIAAFLLLAWATYREMEQDSRKNADELVGEDEEEVESAR